MAVVSLRLLVIILLFQLGLALATATPVDCQRGLTIVFTRSFAGHTGRVFRIVAQNIQKKILPNHAFASDSGLCTKWQSACNFILSKITRFQTHFNNEGLWTKTDADYRHRSSSRWTRPRDQASLGSSNQAVIIMAANAPSNDITSGNESQGRITREASSLLASQLAQGIDEFSTPTHHGSKIVSRAVVNDDFSAQSSLLIRRPDTPVALSAIPLRKGRLVAWKFRRRALNPKNTDSVVHNPERFLVLHDQRRDES